MATIKVKTEVTGSVWKIVTKVGQTLAPGETIMILESMKMEIPVVAEDGGTIAELREWGNVLIVSGGQIINLSRCLVTVHAVAGSRVNLSVWPRSGSTAHVRNSSTLRPCERQLATTVRIRSTKRLPRSLSVP